MSTHFVSYVAIVCAVAGSALAQDAQQVAPEVYKCVLENERVRVCEINFKPGTSMGTHSHPDHVVYFTQSGSIQVTDASGKVRELKPPVNQPLFAPGETHSARNIGTTELKGIVIELK